MNGHDLIKEILNSATAEATILADILPDSLMADNCKNFFNYDPELKAMYDREPENVQNALIDAVDYTATTNTYEGFKKGFNTALSMLGYEPLFEEVDE